MVQSKSPKALFVQFTPPNTERGSSASNAAHNDSHSRRAPRIMPAGRSMVGGPAKGRRGWKGRTAIRTKQQEVSDQPDGGSGRPAIPHDGTGQHEKNRRRTTVAAQPNEQRAEKQTTAADSRDTREMSVRTNRARSLHCSGRSALRIDTHFSARCSWFRVTPTLRCCGALVSHAVEERAAPLRFSLLCSVHTSILSVA